MISAHHILLLAILLLPCGHITSAQQKSILKLSFSIDSITLSADGDTIMYPSRPLQYHDFPVRTSASGTSAAVSFTSFSYTGSSMRRKDTLQVQLSLQVFFVKSGSWMRPDARSNYTLTHEQLHFDITWLVAMRFRQKILDAALSLDDYDSYIQYEYLESFREMNQQQERFDRDTRHGLDPSAQKRWEQSIQQRKLPDE
ncbi:hypothetical protein KTO58_23730 [Chitinophaga pendula]|uniref:DUF922 domain-containing protein n=1 Tax=Chitinophaga TaxID=79328 RepID=UPI000BAEBA78|nr:MULTISPECIES: hypothetical protein [Chitinophaga]ASZ10390.1 hypothetical protein CK934_05035 [Chitinophaga sp. MD30]UCJ06645.1 hypothetical protein KTO58_23730 [Chitinophaga pendula]